MIQIAVLLSCGLLLAGEDTRSLPHWGDGMPADMVEYSRKAKPCTDAVWADVKEVFQSVYRNGSGRWWDALHAMSTCYDQRYSELKQPTAEEFLAKFLLSDSRHLPEVVNVAWKEERYSTFLIGTLSRITQLSTLCDIDNLLLKSCPVPKPNRIGMKTNHLPIKVSGQSVLCAKMRAAVEGNLTQTVR